MTKNKDTPNIRGTTSEIQQIAKKLRHNLTPAEAILWEALRGKKLKGLKFRCQHPVGFFILDFYCPSLKLVIEVDGSSHNSKEEYDQERTKKLNQYGYTVLRFTNEEVMTDISRVLAEIETVAFAP
jgi:very-short-patch-repair endonuclease